MRVIIAGSRTIHDYAVIEQAIDESGFDMSTVLCGMCKGVDLMGKRWAEESATPVEEYPAEWDQYGLRAGPIRNGLMVAAADVLIAIWDGRSRGTVDVIKQALDYPIPVYVVTWKS